MSVPLTMTWVVRKKRRPVWHRRRGRRGAISDIWKLLQDERFHRRQLDGLVGETLRRNGRLRVYPDEGRTMVRRGVACARSSLECIVELADSTRTIVSTVVTNCLTIASMIRLNIAGAFQEQRWNGAKLSTAETMCVMGKKDDLERDAARWSTSARRFTQKGISLSKVAMQSDRSQTGT